MGQSFSSMKIVKPLVIGSISALAGVVALQQLGLFTNPTPLAVEQPQFSYYYMQYSKKYTELNEVYQEHHTLLQDSSLIKDILNSKHLTKLTFYFDNPKNTKDLPRSCIGYKVNSDHQNSTLISEMEKHGFKTINFPKSTFLTITVPIKYKAKSIVCSKLAKIIAKAKMSNEYLAKSYKINDPIPIIEEFSDDKYILRLPYTNIQSFCISTLKEPLLNEEGNKANKQHLLAFESIKSKFLCKKCSADVESIVLAVDCLATKINAKTNAKQILLVTRKKETYHGKLAFPGGRMNYGEMPEAAAIRELKEETGLDGSNPVLFTVEGNPSRDPRGHVVSIVYLMDTDNSKPPVGMDDAETADWYDIDEILKRKEDFAFDHYDIISHYISTIKS